MKINIHTWTRRVQLYGTSLYNWVKVYLILFWSRRIDELKIFISKYILKNPDSTTASKTMLVDVQGDEATQ